MGLFVAEDGQSQGWLAAFICCWTASPDDAYSIQESKTAELSISPNNLCNQQPTPRQPMPLKPAAKTRRFRTGVPSLSNVHDRVHPISDRPPSLKPLDFGETSFLDRTSLHTRQKSSTTLLNRISIGNPMDFRRLDYTKEQRRSLVPLQLGPVILKSEPIQEPQQTFQPSSFKAIDDYDDDSTDDSHRRALGTPFERGQQLTSSASSLTVNSHGQILETPKQNKFTRPALSTQSSSSSIRSIWRQALESGQTTCSASLQSSIEKPRLKRKRSGAKIPGDSADLDVDKEILELNTIVEERRAEANRPRTPADQHIPAVAPRMPVRARSETLTDIGSAFSRPFVSSSHSDGAVEVTAQTPAEALSPVISTKSRLSQPFVSMPDPYVEQTMQQHIRRPSSSVAGWLSNMFSSSNSATPHVPTETTVHSNGTALRNRAISESSLRASLSRTDSPNLTTSSPMSKSSNTHSRTLTAESRMTPVSPISIFDESMELEPKSLLDGSWPINDVYPSQVGVAL